jgi:hypothetical protein
MTNDNMTVIQIISEHKRLPKRTRTAPHGNITTVKDGYKRVQAIVKEHGALVTRHIDIVK